MIEEKKKFEFTEPSLEIVKLGSQDILVKPYLTDNDQRVILKLYLNDLFSGDEYPVLNAENTLLLAVIDLATNIMVVEGEEGKEKAIISLDALFKNQSFIQSVLDKIKNYDEFRNRLGKTVSFMNEQRLIENSLGKKLDNIYEKVISFIEGISDMSPESFEGLKTQLKDLENSPVIKELIPALSKKGQSV